MILDERRDGARTVSTSSIIMEQKKENDFSVVLFFCGDYRTRTGHLQIANLTLYQMS